MDELALGGHGFGVGVTPVDMVTGGPCFWTEPEGECRRQGCSQQAFTVLPSSPREQVPNSGRRWR